MYYSKSSPANRISIPKNYSGNAFIVKDESDRTYQKEMKPTDSEGAEICEKKDDNDHETCDSPSKSCDTEKSLSVPNILAGISLEDLLLVGLILVIHQENPNDSSLILLLILLLAK